MDISTSLAVSFELILFKAPIIASVTLTVHDLWDFIKHCYNQSDTLPISIHTMQPPCINKILASKACRSAIKFGTNISTSQAQMLVNDLSSSIYPFNCAHGRPSLYPLLAISTSYNYNNYSHRNMCNNDVDTDDKGSNSSSSSSNDMKEFECVHDLSDCLRYLGQSRVK